MDYLGDMDSWRSFSISWQKRVSQPAPRHEICEGPAWGSNLSGWKLKASGRVKVEADAKVRGTVFRADRGVRRVGFQNAALHIQGHGEGSRRQGRRRFRQVINRRFLSYGRCA